MKAKGHSDHWVLPVEGLNEEEELKRFSGRPIRNSLEMMPWDASCNQNINKSVDLHVSMTSHLDEDDPRKFSLSTAKKCSLACKRCCEGEPPSKRIFLSSSFFNGNNQERKWCLNSRIGQQLQRWKKRRSGERTRVGLRQCITVASKLSLRVRSFYCC